MLTSNQTIHIRKILEFTHQLALSHYDHQIPASLKGMHLNQYYDSLLSTTKAILNTTVYIAIHSAQDIPVYVKQSIKKDSAILDCFSLLLTGPIPDNFAEIEKGDLYVEYGHANKKILITWFSCGQLEMIVWREDEFEHRSYLDGPSFQMWYESGQPSAIRYQERGKLHRPVTNGPAFQLWGVDGTVELIEYCDK